MNNLKTKYNSIELIHGSLSREYGEVIFGTYRGSVAHGTYVEEYSDDVDMLACYIAPTDCYFGIKPLKNDGAFAYFQNGQDIVYYELKKFLHLLAQGNPNVIPYLWVEPDDVLVLTDFAVNLINNRQAFVSKRFHHAFRGYSLSQYTKMTKTTGNVGEKRRELINKVGYDPKYAHHAIRLNRMYIEFLDTLNFQVRRTNDAQELLDIKMGHWTVEEVIKEYNRLESLAERKEILLPENPNFDIINEICRQETFRSFRLKDISVNVSLRSKVKLDNAIYSF